MRFIAFKQVTAFSHMMVKPSNFSKTKKNITYIKCISLKLTTTFTYTLYRLNGHLKLKGYSFYFCVPKALISQHSLLRSQLTCQSL